MYARQKLQLLSQLDSMYVNFAKYAETKFRVGESNQLEDLTAQARMKEIQLQKEQAKSDVLIQQTILQEWTGTASPLDLPGEIIISESPPGLDSSQLSLNPYLQFQKQQVATSLAAAKLESNKYAPSLQFGYFTQSLGTVAPFQGYNIGLTIPIFKTGQQGRIHAAALQTRIEEKNLDALRLSLQSDFIAAVEEYRKQNTSLQYYSTQGLTLAEKLFRSASKSYSAGDIGYIEYIQAVSQAYQIRESYLQTVLQLNQSIVNINFLIQK
jgi:cobalt-zinc-cadmium resistance protein CzcA